MRPIVRFFQTTLVGGVLFLPPIIVLLVVLGKGLELAHKVVGPLAKHLPFESAIGLPTPVFLAILALVLFCVLAGMFARTKIARKVVLGLENSILGKLPGYGLIKSLSQSTLGVDDPDAFTPVLVRLDDSWQLGLEVERLEYGVVSVFIPDVPNPQSGSFQFVTVDRIEAAGLTLAAAMKGLQRSGVGIGAQLRGFGVNNPPGSGR